jgi:hypothetical protein
MTEEQFINEVALPEAERQGLKVEVRLHERHADGDCCFAVLFGDGRTRSGSPLVVPMSDTPRSAELVRHCLSKIKEFVTTGVVPDGCYAYGKNGKPV